MFNLTSKNSENDNEGAWERHNEMMERLGSINNHVFHTAERVKHLEELCQTMLPLGEGSIQQKRRANLVKTYSRHLVEREKLSPKNASLRARFEVLKFDNDEIIDNIEREIANQEAEIAEREYYNSGVAEKDIENFGVVGNANGGQVGPYDLFAPIYSLLKDKYHDLKEGETIALDWDADEDYYSFIKNRAIIRDLERLGIISKKTDNKGSRGLGSQYCKLNIVDLNKIGEIIYKRPREGGYSNLYEEELREGSLKSIFRIVISPM